MVKSGKLTQILVKAYDEEGNEFPKKVTIDADVANDPILDFGWPVRYYIRDLLYGYPFESDICIDAGGLNHRRSPTYIKTEDINMLLKKFLDKEFIHDSV